MTPMNKHIKSFTCEVHEILEVQHIFKNLKLWTGTTSPSSKIQLHKDVVHSNLNLTDLSHGFWVELHYLLSGIYTE